jgi:hypothetical protein
MSREEANIKEKGLKKISNDDQLKLLYVEFFGILHKVIHRPFQK